jgi:hypothetical protein
MQPRTDRFEDASRGKCAVLLLVVALVAGCAFTQEFFPRDSFPQYWQDIYSYNLGQLNEQPIRPSSGKQVYRFLRLPSFSPDSVVRIEHESENTVLTAKTVRGGEVIEVVRELTSEEWNQFLGLVYQERFWLTATRAEEEYASEQLARELGLTNTIVTYTDGQQWILEASNGEIYHAADAHSPQSGAIYALGAMLLEFAGFEEREL